MGGSKGTLVHLGAQGLQFCLSSGPEAALPFPCRGLGPFPPGGVRRRRGCGCDAPSSTGSVDPGMVSGPVTLVDICAPRVTTQQGEKRDTMGGTMGTLIGVVVVVVVVILGIIVQAVMAKRARAQQAARLQAGNDAPNTPNTVTNPHAHGNPNPDPMSITTNTNASTDRTIFMVVVVKGHVDPEAVAKTIVRALQRARAPSRVFVGVYDATGGGFTPGFQRVCGRDGYPADVLTTGRVRVLAPPRLGTKVVSAGGNRCCGTCMVPRRTFSCWVRPTPGLGPWMG